MDIDLIAEDLNDSYSKKTLLILLVYMGENIPESSSKEFVIDTLIKKFNQSGSLNYLFTHLTKETQLVLKHLVWEGVSNLSVIEKEYNCKLSVGDYYMNSNDPFIQNFKNYYTRELQLSTGLRYLFKQKIPMPEIPNILDIREILYSNTTVLNNFKAITDFISFNHISQREVNKKILKKDIKKYISNFKLPQSIESEINGGYILKFLSYYKFKSGLNNYDNFYNLIKSYRNGSLYDFNIDSHLFFPNVKGISDNEHIELFLKRGRQSVINKIANKDSLSWKSIKALVRQLSLNEDTQIFDTSYFGNILYVKCEPSPENMFSKKLFLQFKRDNEENLVTPMVNGIVLLFNFLGLVDLSISDGVISHFKLSELGKKVFNLPSTFNFEANKTEFSYKFNSEKLIISTTGEDPSKLLFFKRVGKEIGEGLYITNFKEFFKECKTTDDVVNNLESLENLLGEIMPPIWENFIAEINDRVHPIYNEQQLIVVNFPWENKKLIKLITENEKVRSLYYMVEGVKGAFTRDNYNKFKKILQEEGYFL